MKPSFLLFVMGIFLCAAHATSVAAQSVDDASSAEAAPPAAPPAPQPAATPAAEDTGVADMADQDAATGSRRTAKNVIFAELAGNAAIYSINYERFFTDDFAARIGFGYISLSASAGDASASASILFVPLMATYMGIGSADHKLELGAGPLLVNASAGASGVGSSAAHASGFGVGGTATIGYHYVPHDGGFDFNIGFTPIFGAGGFLPWGGLGLGAVF